MRTRLSVSAPSLLPQVVLKDCQHREQSVTRDEISAYSVESDEAIGLDGAMEIAEDNVDG